MSDKSQEEIVITQWGNFHTYMRNNHCVMKEIVVSPNQAISYQYHHYRNEFWYIVCGTGIFTLDGNDFEVSHGDTFDIMVKQKHRIRNTGKSPLVIYEMQYGAKCSEEDITRISDDYGRA